MCTPLGTHTEKERGWQTQQHWTNWNCAYITKFQPTNNIYLYHLPKNHCSSLILKNNNCDNFRLGPSFAIRGVTYAQLFLLDSDTCWAESGKWVGLADEKNGGWACAEFFSSSFSRHHLMNYRSLFHHDFHLDINSAFVSHRKAQLFKRRGSSQSGICEMSCHSKKNNNKYWPMIMW